GRQSRPGEGARPGGAPGPRQKPPRESQGQQAQKTMRRNCPWKPVLHFRDERAHVECRKTGEQRLGCWHPPLASPRERSGR
ncbi:unnamed protein product, partial [Nesidiocoris tenuis]